MTIELALNDAVMSVLAGDMTRIGRAGRGNLQERNVLHVAGGGDLDAGSEFRSIAQAVGSRGGDELPARR